MSHHTDRIQAQLAEARARTERDLGDLQYRTEHRSFIDEGIDLVRGSELGDTLQDAGRTLLKQVKANPLPSALIGAGLVMMATGAETFSPRRKTSFGASGAAPRAGLTQAAEDEELKALYGDDYTGASRTVAAAERAVTETPRGREEDAVLYQVRLYDAYGRELGVQRETDETDESFRGRIDKMVHEAQDRIDHYRGRLNDHAERTGRRLQRGFESASQTTRDYARDARAGLSSGARQTVSTVKDSAARGQDAVKRSAEEASDFLVENPLAAAGLAVFAGLAAGSLFKITEREEVALSKVATAVDEQARKLNEQANEKVRAYAHQTEAFAEQVKDDLSAERQSQA